MLAVFQRISFIGFKCFLASSHQRCSVFLALEPEPRSTISETSCLDKNVEGSLVFLQLMQLSVPSLLLHQIIS